MYNGDYFEGDDASHLFNCENKIFNGFYIPVIATYGILEFQ